MQIIGGLIGVILSILLIIFRVPVKHFIGNGVFSGELAKVFDSLKKKLKL